MKHLEKLTRKRLGEILVDEGLISKSQLADAERERAKTGQQLGTILVESGYLTEWDLAKTVASQYQLPFVELTGIGPSKSVQDLFSVEDCIEKRCYAVDRFGKIVTIAVAEMPDLEFLREVHERTELIPFLFVALMSDIQAKLEAKPPVGALLSSAAPAAGEKPAPRPEPVTAPKPPPAPAAAPPEPRPEPVVPAAADALSVLDQILPEEPAKPDRPQKPKPPPEKPGKTAARGQDGWESIFDSANESVLKEVEGE